MIAAIYPLDDERSIGILLNIDFNELNARAVELGFESLAISAPWRAVHREWCVRRQFLPLDTQSGTPSAPPIFHFAIKWRISRVVMARTYSIRRQITAENPRVVNTHVEATTRTPKPKVPARCGVASYGQLLPIGTWILRVPVVVSMVNGTQAAAVSQKPPG